MMILLTEKVNKAAIFVLEVKSDIFSFRNFEFEGTLNLKVTMF